MDYHSVYLFQQYLTKAIRRYNMADKGLVSNLNEVQVLYPEPDGEHGVKTSTTDLGRTEETKYGIRYGGERDVKALMKYIAEASRSDRLALVEAKLDALITGLLASAGEATSAALTTSIKLTATTAQGIVTVPDTKAVLETNRG